MLVQIKNNIFCVPIPMFIKSYLVFSSTETYYQIRQAVILFVNDTATSLIEKEPMNMQGRLFLDELKFQWSF